MVVTNVLTQLDVQTSSCCFFFLRFNYLIHNGHPDTDGASFMPKNKYIMTHKLTEINTHTLQHTKT